MKKSTKIMAGAMALLLSVSVCFAKTGISKTELNDNSMTAKVKQQPSQLKTVYDSYFSIKDALVKTDVKKTTTGAINLHKAIDAVQVEKLTPEEKSVWMDFKNDLALHTGHIEKLKTIEEQRLHFSFLTESMYKIMKTSKFETPVYYQFCPMYNNNKGGYWLSKDNKIKNPYYGSEMMNCGSTVETIE